MSIELFNEDCLPAMKRYSDKYFELAIVDPPYGIGVNHNMGRRKGDSPSNYKPAVWDNESPSIDFFESLMRVSVDQVIWGANHFISKIPFDSPCWLMWDKGFSEDVSFAQFELAWTSFDTTCKKYDKHPNCDARIHPTQKPVKLYEWLLKNYAKQGDKILDTHLGSGSIAIACYNLDFDLTGFEIDKDYYNGAVNRLEEHKKQGRLFG